MAKGDDSRARNRIDYEKGLAQNNLNNLRSRVVDQQYPMYFNNYKDAVAQQGVERANLLQGYGEFAKTGGFSPLDTMNMRARGMAPNRGIYDAAKRDINRLGGPARTAALSRLQRETGQAMSDTATATEAGIAGLRQQGRLSGLGGMLNTYGATPGLVNMYGNQLLANTGQQVNIEDIQRGLSLGTMNAQIDAGRLPGKWEYTSDRIRDIAGMGASALEFWNPDWFNRLPGGGRDPGAMRGPNQFPPTDVSGQYPQPPPPPYINDTPPPYVVPGSIGGGLPSMPGPPPVGPTVGGVTPHVGTSMGAAELAGSGLIPATQIPAAAGMGGTYGPAAIASQNLTGGMGAGALQGGQVAGLTGGTSTGGAGGASALGTTGSLAIPAAVGVGMYGVMEKGWGRGGEEGIKVNPARDRMTQNYQQRFGGANPYEGMVNALAAHGVVGPQAEAMIKQMYDAKTEQDLLMANDQMRWATSSPEEQAQMSQQYQSYLDRLSPQQKEKWLAGRGRAYRG